MPPISNFRDNVSMAPSSNITEIMKIDLTCDSNVVGSHNVTCDLCSWIWHVTVMYCKPL